eukprot:TRINITY_DN9965_c0_g1_i1.p1 TRINITY_DN9965_c0_g1~~TRINITY_DN9965_c0_g1_i1.p1  ORF type:complete len:355 (+),score=39.52 TRINITY_DN9965_c0_g1_i1:2835-3899(+)
MASTGVESFQYARLLASQGVITFPVLDESTRSEYLAKFRRELKEFPEYRAGVETRVLGGFGALGNPSAFHNPTVRQLRKIMLISILPILRELRNCSDFKFEKFSKVQQLVDRSMYRRAKTKPSAETWHRDICDMAKADDASPCTILGGWINLDPHNHEFSCVKGSHNDPGVLSKTAGFDRFQEKALEAIQRRYDGKTVQVPPGHMIVFFQFIAHQVLGRARDFDMHRVFAGWRLTNSKSDLFDQTDFIRDQSVPFIPSAQVPEIYAPSHERFFQSETVKWMIESFVQNCCDTPKVIPPLPGVTFMVPGRSMKSLRAYALRMYDAYTQEDIDAISTSNIWVLTDPRHGRRVQLRL